MSSIILLALVIGVQAINEEDVLQFFINLGTNLPIKPNETPAQAIKNAASSLELTAEQANDLVSFACRNGRSSLQSTNPVDANAANAACQFYKSIAVQFLHWMDHEIQTGGETSVPNLPTIIVNTNHGRVFYPQTKEMASSLCSDGRYAAMYIRACQFLEKISGFFLIQFHMKHGANLENAHNTLGQQGGFTYTKDGHNRPVKYAQIKSFLRSICAKKLTTQYEWESVQEPCEQFHQLVNGLIVELVDDVLNDEGIQDKYNKIRLSNGRNEFQLHHANTYIFDYCQGVYRVHYIEACDFLTKNNIELLVIPARLRG